MFPTCDNYKCYGVTVLRMGEVGETLFLKPWYLSIIEIGFMDKQVIRRQYAAALCQSADIVSTNVSMFNLFSPCTAHGKVLFVNLKSKILSS